MVNNLDLAKLKHQQTSLCVFPSTLNNIEVLMEFLRWLFVDQLSNLLSLFGIGLTVFFSWGASRAAKAAETAAQETKRRIGSVSLLTELGSAMTIVDDLSRRIESGNWELVEERATSLRIRISPLTRADQETMNDETRSKLIGFVGHMKDLSDLADKVRLTNQKEPNKPKLLRVVRDQKEVLVMATSEIKERLAEHGSQGRSGRSGQVAALGGETN